ncbi:unnamed protein product [Strongylus vulgaris]|uniref:Uncharacterized protein n=1 Tax=Strongylus vulgaris TaxID=40348 RepID=A0A3P7LI94_STRVU|nr:unnamed protein product [Strongylus vulgaris]
MACMAIKSEDSQQGVNTSGQCSACPEIYPGIYAQNCKGLKDRKDCLTVEQADVRRQEIPGKSCALTYVCPEPHIMYGWLKTGGPPVEIKSSLRCTANKRVWMTADGQVLNKISCMSRPLTNVYTEESPCQHNVCVPRKNAVVRAVRDTTYPGICRLEIFCPSGTTKFYSNSLFDPVFQVLPDDPITCADNGAGSIAGYSWDTQSATSSVHVTVVSCLSLN